MEQDSCWNVLLAELNRLNEDLHNRHLSQRIDYLILCERLDLAVNTLRNLRDVIPGENIELLLQSFQLYSVIIERVVNDTSKRSQLSCFNSFRE